MVIFSLIWFALFGASHPFHVSVCNVDVNTEKNRLEITHKIFIDDLEIALRQFGNYEKLDVLKQYDTQEFLDLMTRYYQNNVKIKINNKPAEHLFLGVEKYDDVLWCYIQVSNVKQLRLFEMNNSLLFETFDDQMNLVHVNLAGKTKSLRLRQNEEMGTITF